MIDVGTKLILPLLLIYFFVGLLIVRGGVDLIERKLQKLLQIAIPRVRQRLYVRIEEPREMDRLVPLVYLNASNVSADADLRVLLSRRRSLNVDRVFYDEVKDPEKPTFPMIRESMGPVEYDLGIGELSEKGRYKNVVLGGTFDRLHNGHKVLLSTAILQANNSIICGVTDGEMNKKKKLWELIEPVETRCEAVREFIADVTDQLECETVPIYDPFGPSIVLPDIQCIVVSDETVRGGEAVNEKRQEYGLNLLEMTVVKLVNGDNDKILNETKVSSSVKRRQVLGSILREPDMGSKNLISEKHYLIGLTGGIASGKTHISKYLESLGCEVIDCDQIGHQIFDENKKMQQELTTNFGKIIVNEDGSINRVTLGAIVFEDKAKLAQLNNIVWPTIFEKVADIVKESKRHIVVIDAALLLEANWDKYVQQVWTVFVPREEAIQRICNRDKLSVAQAEARVNSQMSNIERLARSNVAFCSLWEYNETERQVQKAFDLLKQKYLKKGTSI